MNTMPSHLTPTSSDRGLQGLPTVPSEYGGYARVYESSAAFDPHVWFQAVVPIDLNNPTGPTMDSALHLTAENALNLAEQLVYLVQNHYQGPPAEIAERLGRIAEAIGLEGRR